MKENSTINNVCTRLCEKNQISTLILAFGSNNVASFKNATFFGFLTHYASINTHASIDNKSFFQT